MGKFNNILINNNIDVFNEYRITDRSYTLAKVSSDNTTLMIGSYSLYTGLYGSYVSIDSNTNIDITTSEYINIYGSNGINEYTPEVNIQNNNSGYSESKLNVYGNVIARYSYKIGCKISDEEKIFDALSYDVGPEILFVGHTDKTKPGTNLCVQGRKVTLSSSRDSNTPDSDTTEGVIDIHCYNLKTTSNNKSYFVSSYDMNITSNNSFIQSRAYKNNIIAAYTNARNDQSTICLYGNNAGVWSTSDIGSGNKTGDIYIKSTKNLYASSVDTLITSTGDSKISAGKDVKLASTENTIVKSHKNIEIKTYTDTNDTDSNASNIILYGNNAGSYQSNDLIWSGNSKIGDILINSHKDLNISSDTINIDGGDYSTINISNIYRIHNIKLPTTTTGNIATDPDVVVENSGNITIYRYLYENIYIDTKTEITDMSQFKYITFKSSTIRYKAKYQTYNMSTISDTDKNHIAAGGDNFTGGALIDYLRRTYKSYIINYLNNPTAIPHWDNPIDNGDTNDIPTTSINIEADKIVLKNNIHFGTSLPTEIVNNDEGTSSIIKRLPVEGQIFFQIIN